MRFGIGEEKTTIPGRVGQDFNVSGNGSGRLREGPEEVETLQPGQEIERASIEDEGLRHTGGAWLPLSRSVRGVCRTTSLTL